MWGILFNLMQVDPLLTWIFEVGTHTNLIWILNQEDILLIWATSSAGNLDTDVEKGSFCFFFPACSHIASIFIPSLALESTSPGITVYTKD